MKAAPRRGRRASAQSRTLVHRERWLLPGNPGRTLRRRRAGAPSLRSECARALVRVSGAVHPAAAASHLVSALHFPTFSEGFANSFANSMCWFSYFLLKNNNKGKPSSFYQAPHLKGPLGLHFACRGSSKTQSAPRPLQTLFALLCRSPPGPPGHCAQTLGLQTWALLGLPWAGAPHAPERRGAPACCPRRASSEALLRLSDHREGPRDTERFRWASCLRRRLPADAETAEQGLK